MDVEEQIKDILRPHFGHLNFLMKIKREEISISDIGYLVELLNNKAIVSNLPKELHNYNSYYTLLKDYFFVKRNYTLIRFIKDNVSASAKDYFLKVVEDEINAKFLYAIMNNEALTKLFLRWSSRIQSKDAAINYLKSVVLDTTVFTALDDKESVLVELKDFSKQSKLIPTSWCIKDASTFDRYKRSQRMFLLKHHGMLFGVNYSGSRITSMFNSNNKSLDQHDPIFEIAKTEMIKLNLFGNKSLEDKADNAMNEIIGLRTYPTRDGSQLVNPNVEPIYNRARTPRVEVPKRTFMDSLRRLFN